MAKLSFHVGHVYCFDCVKAIETFVGNIKGVQSVSVQDSDYAVIEYDPAGLEFDEKTFTTIVRENIERLGFTIKGF